MPRVDLCAKAHGIYTMPRLDLWAKAHGIYTMPRVCKESELKILMTLNKKEEEPGR